MSDVDSQVAALKERANSASRAKMLAEVKVQQAKQSVEEASAILKEKFGVSSLEEAKELMAALRTELDSKVAEVSALMDEFEAQQ